MQATITAHNTVSPCEEKSVECLCNGKQYFADEEQE